MVKQPQKPLGIINTPQNNFNQTLKLDSKLSKKKDKKEYKPTPKSRQQIYQENYQKNKEKKKAQQKERYYHKKEKTQQINNEQLSKYYETEAFKILMSFKEYIELNQEKRKNWLNFAWTFKELADNSHIEVKNMAISDIIQVMKLREQAENLINDYWETARNEIRKGKSWNTLDQEQKDRLIKYWGYEKARIENNYLTEEERLEKQSREYLKEIELVKYHEERGKIKCPCYACEAKKEVQKEIKTKWKKDLDNEEGSDKEQCPECKRWVKELDEESGVCKKCISQYE